MQNIKGSWTESLWVGVKANQLCCWSFSVSIIILIRRWSRPCVCVELGQNIAQRLKQLLAWTKILLPKWALEVFILMLIRWGYTHALKTEACVRLRIFKTSIQYEMLASKPCDLRCMGIQHKEKWQQKMSGWDVLVIRGRLITVKGGYLLYAEPPWPPCKASLKLIYVESLRRFRGVKIWLKYNEIWQREKRHLDICNFSTP